jgi:hypothetical protein
VIGVRRAAKRVHCTHGEHEVWHTFGALGLTDRVPGLGALLTFDEEYLSPGSRETARAMDAEVVLYVVEGGLSFRHSVEAPVLVASTFVVYGPGRARDHQMENRSRTHATRLFRIGLHVAEDASTRARWRLFGIAGRRDVLCAVASLGGQDGSLPLAGDAQVFSAVLTTGFHVAREIAPGRGIWIHVVTGSGRLGRLLMNRGDGAGLIEERSVAFTALEDTEILVVDVPAWVADNGG